MITSRAIRVEYPMKHFPLFDRLVQYVANQKDRRTDPLSTPQALNPYYGAVLPSPRLAARFGRPFRREARFLLM